MTKHRFTPAYPVELRERGVRLFRKTVAITPVTQQRIGRSHPSSAVRLTACASGASKPNAMSGKGARGEGPNQGIGARGW